MVLGVLICLDWIINCMFVSLSLLFFYILSPSSRTNHSEPDHRCMLSPSINTYKEEDKDKTNKPSFLQKTLLLADQILLRSPIHTKQPDLLHIISEVVFLSFLIHCDAAAQPANQH